MFWMLLINTLRNGKDAFFIDVKDILPQFESFQKQNSIDSIHPKVKIYRNWLKQKMDGNAY